MGKPLMFIHPPTETCSLDGNWWLFGLRGVLSVLFGIIAWFIPATGLVALTALFGAFSLIDGMLHLVSGLRLAWSGRRKGALVFSGVLGLGAGMIALVMPLVATLGLTVLLWTMLSFWAVGTGVAQVTAAIRLRQEVKGERLLALTGLLTTALGLGMLMLLVTRPLESLPALGMAIGIYALVSGCMLLRLALVLFQRTKVPTLRTQPR